MNGTVLADKAGAKVFEDFMGADQNSPEAVCVFWIVRCALCILIERDGVGNFNRHLPDFHMNVERLQTSHELVVKIGDRFWRKRHFSFRVLAGSNQQLVMDEVELNLEDSSVEGDGRSREPACSHVKWHLPPMINSRAEREPHFAHDLRPHMKCRVGILPRIEW